MKRIIEIFDRRFTELQQNSRKIIEKTPDALLYQQLNKSELDFPFNSVGGNILRSTGVIEQTFGGITVRLWDDPFEWTLPEELKSAEKILDYLSESEATRKRGFALFKSDEDLMKEIPAPEHFKSLFQILLETVAKAENFQGRAISIRQSLA